MERNLYRITKFNPAGYAEIDYLIFATHDSEAKEMAFDDAEMTGYKGRILIEKLTDNHVDSKPQAEVVFDDVRAEERVALDGDQKTIIEHLRDLLNEAEKNGIRFIFDGDGLDCPLYALNMRHINSFDSCPENVDNGIPVKVNNLELVALGLYNHYDDDSLYVKLKG